MSTWLSFFLLLATSLLALSVTKGTVRLYFTAQIVVTVAQFAAQWTHHYTLIYICGVLLAFEMSIFLLWDAGVSKLTWRTAVTWAAFMTAFGLVGLYELSLTDWYVLDEGIMLLVIGMAMLLVAKGSREPLALSVIGTLTWVMGMYDLLWLLSPAVRQTNGWMPSTMCSMAFLTITIGEMFGRSHIRANQT